MIDLERPINAIKDVATHVAKRTIAEVVPTVPLVGMNIRMKVAIRCRPNPFIPVESCRDRNRRGTRTHSSFSAVCPAMRFGYISHNAAPHKFAKPAVAVFAMPLVAHLRRDLGLVGHF